MTYNNGDIFLSFTDHKYQNIVLIKTITKNCVEYTPLSEYQELTKCCKTF